MQGEVVEIPKQVLASVETLDELYDWLTVQHAGIMAELREARQAFAQNSVGFAQTLRREPPRF